MSDLNTLIVPEKINVGFQKRSDTYSGKLAYVTYKDHKGVLRKEKSWLGWCSKNIPKVEFDNVPLSGFVLNREVGGVRHSWSSWNPRMEKVRVYDPRGFEIEIGIPNMLFIFQECSSIKGKGIEGEMVYGWDGTELILVPSTCEEYLKSVQYTKKVKTKFDAKSLMAGYDYITKDGKQTHTYLGKFPCWTYMIKGKMYHVFSTNGYERFITSASPDYDCQSGENPNPKFAEFYKEFTSNKRKWDSDLKTGKVVSLEVRYFSDRYYREKNMESQISRRFGCDNVVYGRDKDRNDLVFGVEYNGEFYICKISGGYKTYDYPTNKYVEIPAKAELYKKIQIKDGLIDGKVLKTPIELTEEDLRKMKKGVIVAKTDFNADYDIDK